MQRWNGSDREALGCVSKTLLMSDFNFPFENLENNNSRKLHIIDIFNFTQSVTEPAHNQGHLLDLMLSKQSNNILLSTKLHYGFTSDHTAILCKLDIYIYIYQYPCKSLKPFYNFA